MTDWSVLFTDADGVVQATLPGHATQGITIPLSDTEQWQVTVPIGTDAAREILTASPLPTLECMVKRDDRVVVWGPCESFQVTPEGNVDVTCAGAVRHLDRTTVGPAALPNEHTDPDFDNSLTDWDVYRTDLVVVGELVFPTFVSNSGAAAVVSSGTGIPEPPVTGQLMVRFRGDLLGSNEGCQVAEDFTVTPSAYRDYEVTARAAFYVTPATPFVRTNIDGAIYVSAHDPGASFPDAYFAPDLIAVAEWPEIPIQGTWFDVEATLTLPAGSGTWLVHVAYSPPQMDTFMCLPEAVFDKAIEVTGSTAPSVVSTLVTHAQDAAYGHVDRNIATSVTTGGPRIDRFYRHAEHQYIGSSIRELVDQGLAEWRTSYTPTTRTMVVASTVGAVVHSARVISTEHGHVGAAVVSWTRQWSRGSDIVTAQQSGTRAEKSASASLGLAWEEILPSPDYVPRWRMPEWATNKVGQTSTPEILQVEWEAGSPWVTGDALVGDYCDVTVEIVGAARLSGRWRCVQILIDPETDRAVVDLAPVSVTTTAL